jgi:hypothetical protein
MRTLIALSFLMVQPASADPLDGCEFAITAIADGEQSADVVIFKAGRIESAGMRTLGSPAATYRLKANGTAMVFTAEARLPDGGELRWSGATDGDAIHGTLLCERAGEPPMEFRFTGKRARPR